ncbi:MAG: hypothetical protein GWO20_19875 [Candidatus Korarchaeota archaeon]|nr:hypothetical protein [Candidatus Korarchaeota archaeon]NIU85493.1 hypothetical protein [Candidatus Thorarchaeota archaeon]NIW15610.1 hypothetical protein [Candidatus Thorarchaeota archaeon]NIW53541.1 hypothetical protein [Candidatus Korarchaeota archaeon]
MIQKSGSYLACLECRRVFQKSQLKRQKKEANEQKLKCPYCGSTRFTNKFTNLILCLDPEKAQITEEIEPKIKKPGIYAFFLE